MPISLRARPTCHYCGKRNKPLSDQSKFTCQYCQAENYLDESGGIRDVPSSSSTEHTQRYAVPVTPAFERAEDSIFCSTCLKNQYMYNSALAEYLPEPDHPEYDQFEAAIPAFKRDLERRFPTCCANCEPKVRAQLQQATYNARSDHVRRVLDRSRHRCNAHRLGWRSLLVNAAQLGWTVSLAIQLVWHALGSQTYGNIVVPDLRPQECFTAWPVPVQCPSMVEQYIGLALLLGVVCIWWNPKWQHKLEGREGRLIDLDKFYKSQIALLALRFALWVVCKDVPSLAAFRSSLHAIALVLISMVAVWTRYGIIQVYAPRIVDWSQNPAPLLDSKHKPWPVNVFDTSTSTPLQPWRPPTPPMDEDAMEWDPTPPAFAPDLKKRTYKTTEPSPFQGTLPALPKSGIYKTSRTDVVEEPKAIGLPPGFFDKSHGRPLGDRLNTSTDDRGLAQPKFFPVDARADTGLESIFDTVFSLKDDTTVTSGSSGTRELLSRPDAYSQVSNNLRQTQETPRSLPRRLSAYRAATITILGTLTLLASAKSYIDIPLLRADSAISVLQLLQLVPATNVCIHLLTMPSVNVLEIGVLVAESVGLLAMDYMRPESQSLLATLWDKLMVAVLTLLLFHEIYYLCIADNTQLRRGIQIDAGGATKEYAPPWTPLDLPSEPPTPELSNLRHTSSDESIGSTASGATSSTLSGWKTPVRSHRDELRIGSASTTFGLTGLSLQTDDGFGIGNSVAGPRTRKTTARGGQGRR